MIHSLMIPKHLARITFEHKSEHARTFPSRAHPRSAEIGTTKRASAALRSSRFPVHSQSQTLADRRSVEYSQQGRGKDPSSKDQNWHDACCPSRTDVWS